MTVAVGIIGRGVYLLLFFLYRLSVIFVIVISLSLSRPLFMAASLSLCWCFFDNDGCFGLSRDDDVCRR